MSNVFDVLKRMGGGVVVENGVTYVTHPNPPANDNSQKIATTAWVRDITDGLEESVSGGMFPKIQNAVISGRSARAPSGGTWWCVARPIVNDYYNVNKAYSGGAVLVSADENLPSTTVNNFVCIKIA